MSEPAPQSRVRHFPALDGLRGIAILLVMLYHFIVRVPWSSQVFGEAGFRVCQAGWIGVEVFFVLSGFLITGILDDTRDDRRYFSAFYMRRALRILPAYYCLLIVSFWLLPLAGTAIGGLGVDADKQWWFWSLLTNWLFALEETKSTKGMYLWSLAVEEQFYLLWPIVVWAVPRRALTTLCTVGCFAMWVTRPLVVYYGASPAAVYTMTITHADGLLLGAWLSLAWRNGSFAWICRTAPWVAFASFFAMLLIASVNARFVFYDELVAAFGLSVTAITSAGIVVSMLRDDNRSFLRRVCESRMLCNVGKISFGLYLLHVPAAIIAGKLVFRSPYSDETHSVPVFFAYLIASTALSIMFAIFSWLLIESPFLSMKRYFPYCRDLA